MYCIRILSQVINLKCKSGEFGKNSEKIQETDFWLTPSEREGIMNIQSPSAVKTVLSRRDVRRGGKTVSEIRVKENETLESALKRFKRQCARSGVLAEVRKREHYEKPSVKRKKKAEAARKRKY